WGDRNPGGSATGAPGRDNHHGSHTPCRQTFGRDARFRAPRPALYGDGWLLPGRPHRRAVFANHKNSSSADVIARDGAMIASLALQHGCPLEALTGAVLRDPNGEAASPIGAALDLIVRRP